MILEEITIPSGLIQPHIEESFKTYIALNFIDGCWRSFS